MNSMFSCFDALLAEVVFGKTATTTGRSFVAVSGDANPSTEKTIGRELVGKREFSDKEKTKKPQKIRSAPEFDGLHCFETLVSY